MNKSSTERKVVAVNAHINKEERSQINNLTLPLKELEENQTKPQVSRRKEIKIVVEINEIKNRKNNRIQNQIDFLEESATLRN